MQEHTPQTHLLDLLTGYVLRVIDQLDDARRVVLQQREPALVSAWGLADSWVRMAESLFAMPGDLLQTPIHAAWQAQQVVSPLPPDCFAMSFVAQHLMHDCRDELREMGH